MSKSKLIVGKNVLDYLQRNYLHTIESKDLGNGTFEIDAMGMQSGPPESIWDKIKGFLCWRK